MTAQRPGPDIAPAAAPGTTPVAAAPAAGPLPALYLGHGAPPLLDDPVWMGQLASWARDLPRPSSILIVSAHWQTAPMALGATTSVPLVYDFYGFPERCRAGLSRGLAIASPLGFEPRTGGLKVPCSATELRARVGP